MRPGRSTYVPYYSEHYEAKTGTWLMTFFSNSWHLEKWDPVFGWTQYVRTFKHRLDALHVIEGYAR